jgi:hypothetical protein
MGITMIGLDTAKSVFQIHGVDASGKAFLKRKLQRSELISFLEQQEACMVVMEACGAAHHWARVLSGLGHEVKLIAPEAVKPFVKRGRKNDAADAAALCIAASRPEIAWCTDWSIGAGSGHRRPRPLTRIPTLPFKLNQNRRHHIPRQQHKVTNWLAYEASLRRRGSLTLWFTDEAIAAWAAEPRTTRAVSPGTRCWRS